VRDVPAAYARMVEAINKVNARVLNAQLNESDRTNINGIVDFEIRREDEPQITVAILGLGELYTRQVQRNPEARGTIDTKIRIQVVLLDIARIPAREQTTMQIAAKDVRTSYNDVREALTKNGARFINARLDESDPQSVVGTLEFEIARKDEGAAVAVLRNAGDVFSRNVQRSPENSGALDSKAYYNVTLITVTRIPPRNTVILDIETGDVAKVGDTVLGWVSGKGGKVVASQLKSRGPRGVPVFYLVADVPLRDERELVNKIIGVGPVRNQDNKGNPNAPDGDFALSRLVLTFEAPQAIVADDSGAWVSVRSGLTKSLFAIFKSVEFVVIGVVFVGPWAVILWFAWRMIKRSRTPAAPAATGTAGGSTGSSTTGS
jgi:hypothetical protein